MQKTKKIKKVAILLMSIILVFTTNFFAFGASNDSYSLTPISREGKVSIKATEKLSSTYSQVGDPQETIVFYYMHHKPIVMDPATGQLYLVNMNYGIDKQVGSYLANHYSAAQTSQIYAQINNAIAAEGYQLCGWQVEIKFRFDYTNPRTWTYSIDGGESVTEGTPVPHNRYQTYIMTYNSFTALNNLLATYNTSLRGTVLYRNPNNNTLTTGSFGASTTFTAN